MKDIIYLIVSYCNLFICRILFLYFPGDKIVKHVNRSLDDGAPEATHILLQKPEGMFSRVLPRSAFLYHNGLYKAKQVSCFTKLILMKLPMLS